MSRKKFNPKESKWAEQYDQIKEMSGRQIIIYVKANTSNNTEIKIPLKNKRGIIKQAIFALRDFPLKTSLSESKERIIKEVVHGHHPPIGVSPVIGCKANSLDECIENVDSCNCTEESGVDVKVLPLAKDLPPRDRHRVDLSRMNKATLIDRAYVRFNERIGGFLNLGWFTSRTTLVKRLTKLYEADDYLVVTGIHGV